MCMTNGNIRNPTNIYGIESIYSEGLRAGNAIWLLNGCVSVLVLKRSNSLVEKGTKQSFPGGTETSYSERELLHLFQI